MGTTFTTLGTCSGVCFCAEGVVLGFASLAVYDSLFFVKPRLLGCCCSADGNHQEGDHDEAAGACDEDGGEG